jgi:hypothetical protein
MEETHLSLSIGGLPPFSSRGCTQVLTPLSMGDTHRTVNGELVTTASPLHHKYQTVIKGQDKLPIALDSLWKGQDVVVGCIQHLWQKAGGVELQLSRMPVEGSVIALNEQKEPVQIQTVHGKTVSLEAPAYVGYRPLLTMKITDFGYETGEWKGEGCEWFLKLEEV